MCHTKYPLFVNLSPAQSPALPVYIMVVMLTKSGWQGRAEIVLIDSIKVARLKTDKNVLNMSLTSVGVRIRQVITS